MITLNDHLQLEKDRYNIMKTLDIGLINWVTECRSEPPQSIICSQTAEQLWQRGRQEEALTHEIRQQWLLSYQHQYLSQIQSLGSLMRLQAFYQSLQRIHPQNKVLQQHIEQTILSPIFLRDSLPALPSIQKNYLPDMHYIAGGTFAMGSELSFDERIHDVTVDDFFMAKTTVTVKQYMECVKAGYCRPPEWLEDDTDGLCADDQYQQLGQALTGANYPIVGVNWDDAVAYTEWLSVETGEKYRLPTEAEWEYAARAGSETLYPWGDAIDGCHANYQSVERHYSYTSPVASFDAQGGLYDMQGNVWEWTGSAYDACYNGSEMEQAAAEDTRPRVLRGGSWCNSPWKLRSASRYYWLAFAYRDASIGFRVAKGCD